MNRHFTKEDKQMANKAHETMLNTIHHWEMQIKTTVNHPLTPVGMAEL